ncbi:hypothetical protein BSKO_13219 [Bryopsis sp. KO-2023]|nr:hypothetical protein BSKO_13219 [Bryopsis sp. KO-2023]
MMIIFSRSPLLFSVWLCFLAAAVNSPAKCTAAKSDLIKGGFKRGQIPDYPAPSEEVVDPETPPVSELDQEKEDDAIKEVVKLVESYVDEKKERFLEEWSKLVPLMVVLLAASGVLYLLFASLLMASCMGCALMGCKQDPLIFSTSACVTALGLVVIATASLYFQPEANRSQSDADSMHRGIQAIGPVAAVVDTAVVLMSVGVLLDARKERCQFLAAASLAVVLSSIIQVASLFILEAKLKVLAEMGAEYSKPCILGWKCS